MDPIVPVENGPEADIENRQDQLALLLQGCLSEPEILSVVLNNLSNIELLKLSLLNKLLNFEARRVLKARGNLIATTSESNTCEDLDDFAMGLQFMRIMPYSGMTIKLGGQHACSGPTLGAHNINVAYEEIRDLIPWRTLAVQFYRDWDQHEDCPGFLLLKKLLPLIRSLLQEFSLLVVTNRRPFLQSVLQDYSFSNLSTLKFRDVDLYTSSEEYTNYIKNVVSRTPNLQTLYTEGFVNLRENLLEGSRALHVGIGKY